MVLVAHLATAGGVRAPLASVASQVFADLTEQLAAQGVSKTVIADMFGMALSTYHRRVRAAAESQTVAGQSVWEAVLDRVRQEEPVSAAAVMARFSRDDPTVVASVLRDLTESGMVYRSGRGQQAVYRVASASDFGDGSETRSDALRHILWLTVVRRGPIELDALASEAQQPAALCQELLEPLVGAGFVERRQRGTTVAYDSVRLDVPVGATAGWEAAVLDHFQALVTAVCVKLRLGAGSAEHDAVGGSTYTLDVWPGHPLESEARETLQRLRASLADLRQRIDAYNVAATRPAGESDREVTVYVGQYVKSHDGDEES